MNTYKLYNAEGEGVLVKYHWVPKQGVKTLTGEQASAIQEKIQSRDLGSLRRDRAWRLSGVGVCVQIMPDDKHPELDFDPLDTKVWREDKLPLLSVGKMVLNKNPKNYFCGTSPMTTGAKR